MYRVPEWPLSPVRNRYHCVLSDWWWTISLQDFNIIVLRIFISFLLKFITLYRPYLRNYISFETTLTWKSIEKSNLTSVLLLKYVKTVKCQLIHWSTLQWRHLTFLTIWILLNKFVLKINLSFYCKTLSLRTTRKRYRYGVRMTPENEVICNYLFLSLK